MARRIVFLLAFAFVATACTGSSTSSSTTTPSGFASTITVATSLPDATTTTTLKPTWTELVGVESLPREVQDELLALVRQTEKIRELQFIESPHITVVSESELETRVRALIEEDAADLPADEALYKLLGLLAPDADLSAMLSDVYGEQVAGFYDGETKELVVPMRETGFSPVQRSTMVHELTHALTDQHFDFDPVMTAMFDQDRLDQASAFQGLVEGDASFAEYQFLGTLNQAELGEFMAEAFSIDTSALDAAPLFVQDSLIFPYDSGLAFAQALYGAGGWEAVNEAYSTMPGLPGSTEQIMTPSEYRRDLPHTAHLPEITLPGYTLERQSVWGELGFRVMIDQVLGESTGVDAADGWGGDTYYQWFDGQNAAIVIAYVGDTEADVTELEDALVDFAFKSVPEEDYVWVEEIDGQLYFIAADSPDIGLSILSAVKG
jgi:hypothetical protein